MSELDFKRIQWKDNPNAVELGFDFYLQLLERRLKGENISMVQNLRKFFKDELGIDIRETQARGLMHKSSSIFIDYVREIAGEQFIPGIEFWDKQGLFKFQIWKEKFYQSRFLKSIYSYQCQICQHTFSLPAGNKYAEAHHLKPLGEKHNGIDKENNMIVLCPNHHAMMDYGVIAIHPDTNEILSYDKSVVERGKELQLIKHAISKEFFEYHINHIYNRVI